MAAKGATTTEMSEDTAAGIMVGGCLPTPRQDRVADWLARIGDRADEGRLQAWLVEHGYASIEEWMESAADELYQSLAERYARERSSQSNPALDSIQSTQHRRADVASNYQRLISAMSLAGASDPGLAASCEARHDRLGVESSFM